MWFNANVAKYVKGLKTNELGSNMHMYVVVDHTKANHTVCTYVFRPSLKSRLRTYPGAPPIPAANVPSPILFLASTLMSMTHPSGQWHLCGRQRIICLQL